MQDKSIGTEIDLHPAGDNPSAPIDVAEKQPERFIPKTDLVQNCCREEQESALGLIDHPGTAMVKIPHFPSVEFGIGGKQAAQADGGIEDISEAGEAPARGLDLSLKIAHLRCDHAGPVLFETGEQYRQGFVLQQNIGIEKQNEIGFDSLQSLIDCAGKAFVFWIQDQVKGNVLPQYRLRFAQGLPGAICAQVIDHNDLT